MKVRKESTLEKKRAAMPKIDSDIKLTFPIVSKSSPIAISITGISKSLGGKKLFKDLDLDIRSQDRLAIMGSNGSGKTTLLNIIANIVSPDCGTFQASPRCIIHYYTQDHSEILKEKQVLSAVTASPSNTMARTLLGCLGFQRDDVNKSISDLSQGQLARVALARCLLSGANLLLLDEPTNHLDIRAQEAVESGLSQYQGAVIYVSHDRRFLHQLGGRVLEIRDGITRFFQDIDEFLKYT